MEEDKKNIGLYFYRGYFEDYFGKNGILVDERTQKNRDRQLEKANEKNKSIADITDLRDKKYLEIGGKYGFELKVAYPGLYSGSGYAFGAGLNGEFQTGFLFDHTTGLPYLPGTSVKGAIRSIFPNYSGGKIAKRTKNQDERSEYIWKEYFSHMPDLCFTEKFKKDETKKVEIIREIELEIFEGRDIAAEKKKEKNEEKYLSVYKRDIFFDAYISEAVKKGETKGRFLGTDYITPHKDPLKNPTPLPFLKILSGTAVCFQFGLHDGYYLKAEGKKELFKKILFDFGIGAKTNVGYGQFSEVVVR